MTALVDALLLAIERLDTLRTGLRVLLTMVDEEGQARAHEIKATPHTLPQGITEREHEILLLAGQGLSNIEIGERLHLVESTVKLHLTHAYKKLGIVGRSGTGNRIRAVLLAVELGLAPTATQSAAFRYNRISPDDLQVGPKSRLDPVNPNNPFQHRPKHTMSRTQREDTSC